MAPKSSCANLLQVASFSVVACVTRERHYITDILATVMHQLGLDARRLVVPGRRRLDIDYGQPIREIMA